MSWSRWMSLLATNDSWVVVCLFKKVIFPHLGVPCVLISDNVAHFIEKKVEALMKKYGVYHKYGLRYHPKRLAKWRSLTGKLRLFWKKQLQDQDKIGRTSSMMLYELIERLSRVLLTLRHLGWFMVSHATSPSSWSKGLLGRQVS